MLHISIYYFFKMVHTQNVLVISNSIAHYLQIRKWVLDTRPLHNDLTTISRQRKTWTSMFHNSGSYSTLHKNHMEGSLYRDS